MGLWGLSLKHFLGNIYTICCPFLETVFEREGTYSERQKTKVEEGGRIDPNDVWWNLTSFVKVVKSLKSAHNKQGSTMIRLSPEVLFLQRHC